MKSFLGNCKRFLVNSVKGLAAKILKITGSLLPTALNRKTSF